MKQCGPGRSLAAELAVVGVCWVKHQAAARVKLVDGLLSTARWCILRMHVEFRSALRRVEDCSRACQDELLQHRAALEELTVGLQDWTTEACRHASSFLEVSVR